MLQQVLRIKQRCVFAPLIGLRMPDGERDLTIVGTVHLAHPRFYYRVLRVIENHEQTGAQVIYEVLGEGEPPTLTEYGLVTQTTILKPRNHWLPVHHMHTRELELSNQKKSALSVVQNLGSEIKAICELGWRDLCERVAPQLSPTDQHAVEVITAVLARQDVVTLWGVAHLPGLMSPFVAQGATIKYVRWLHAMKLPPV